MFVEQHANDFPTLAVEEEMIVAMARRAAEERVEPESLIALVDSLFTYVDVGGHWRTGIEMRGWQLTARREVGDRTGEGTTLNNLGSLADSLGRKEEARAYLEQALVIMREVGDRGGEGTTLCNLGDTLRETGHVAEGRMLIDQARAIFELVGDQYGVGKCYEFLGRCDEDEGNRSAAIAHYRYALQGFEQLGSPDAETMRAALRRLDTAE